MQDEGAGQAGMQYNVQGSLALTANTPYTELAFASFCMALRENFVSQGRSNTSDMWQPLQKLSRRIQGALTMS